LAGLPKASARAWILVLGPPRDRPIATVVRAHQHSAGAAKKTARKRFFAMLASSPPFS
jgi:hypothetical protein